MHLGTYYDGVALHRDDKLLYARFLVPHRVISTCAVAGGLHDDFAYLYNHQACEPAGHEQALHRLFTLDPQAYRQLICQAYGLPAARCATLSTAANMRCAAIKEARFRDLTVVAVCTGGVETNAGRAGDPATVYEWQGAYETVADGQPACHGTLNTLLLSSHELTPGAMVNAVMTATEAKTAALQELAVSSRYSDGLATGTGTDQIGVAARLRTGAPLTGAGKHCVLGELIGVTVHAAMLEALKLQNDLTPESQRSIVRHLIRFGATRELLIELTTTHLHDAEMAQRLRLNFSGVEHDPLVVAAVAALAHVRDKVVWNTLPRSCIAELWATYGAQIASAVSGDYEQLPRHRETLAAAGYTAANADLLRLIGQAIALGFQRKWPEPAVTEETHAN